MNKQLHVVASAGMRSGGEGLAAMRYAESVSRSNCNVTLLSKHFSGGQVKLSLDEGSFVQRDAPIRKNLVQELFVQYRFINEFCVQEQIELIHIHGMWSPLLVVAALVARSKSLPIVISPHGCLMPVALGYKSQKKWLAMKIYQRAILRMASMFVASANQELESIRRLGFRQPVAIIPNGVDVGASLPRDASNEVKTILFLSRVHPKKGLLDLVEAWAIIRQPGWRIVIAGGDEDGYRANVEALIRAKRLESDFKFMGFVDGATKEACFKGANIFILPTYTENFGIAVAEALANELPVITTTAAPWQDLVDYRCGWWVSPGVKDISNALKAAIECDPKELMRMGQRGRRLVINKYSWNKIGCDGFNVTKWLLNPTYPKPAIVKEYAQTNLEECAH